jgi:hypothetical protein
MVLALEKSMKAEDGNLGDGPVVISRLAWIAAFALAIVACQASNDSRPEAAKRQAPAAAAVSAAPDPAPQGATAQALTPTYGTSEGE